MTAAAERRERLRVLLVDDSADAREMYDQYLTWSGLEPLQAADAAEAFARATAETPDVIVMDLALPGVDGWAATRAIKADPRTSRIPVLALSGHARERFREEAAFAGYLLKPCLPDDLIAAIHRAHADRERFDS